MAWLFSWEGRLLLRACSALINQTDLFSKTYFSKDVFYFLKQYPNVFLTKAMEKVNGRLFVALGEDRAPLSCGTVFKKPRSHSQSSYGINVTSPFFFSLSCSISEVLSVCLFFFFFFLPSDTYLSSVRETSAQTWYHTNQFEKIAIPFSTHLPSSSACLQGAQDTKQLDCFHCIWKVIVNWFSALLSTGDILYPFAAYPFDREELI